MRAYVVAAVVFALLNVGAPAFAAPAEEQSSMLNKANGFGAVGSASGAVDAVTTTASGHLRRQDLDDGLEDLTTTDSSTDDPTTTTSTETLTSTSTETETTTISTEDILEKRQAGGGVGASGTYTPGTITPYPTISIATALV